MTEIKTESEKREIEIESILSRFVSRFSLSHFFAEARAKKGRKKLWRKKTHLFCACFRIFKSPILFDLITVAALLDAQSRRNFDFNRVNFSVCAFFFARIKSQNV